MTTWFYADGQRQVGPYTEEAFQALVAAGTVHGDTLVWNESMTDWRPYRETLVPGGPVSGDQAVCSMCNRILPEDEVIEYQGHYVCALCKPEFVHRLKDGLPIVGLTYAGFWIRFVAYMIDYLILWVVSCGITLASLVMMIPFFGTEAEEAINIFIQLTSTVVSLGINCSYATFFVGKYGGTPGKLLLRLKVVRPDGSRVTYWRAFGRYWATIVSSLTCFIGFIIAAFDEEKRTLHDHIASTRVIVAE